MLRRSTRALETSAEGLPAAEAAARQSLYGPNLLSEQQKESGWRKLASQFAHPVALLLLAVGILMFLRGDPVLGVAIFALVLANAGFSFWRGYRSEQAMEKLRQALPDYARAIRGGKDTHLHARELVPGDILVLAEGDNISADARVVEEYGLRVDNATLTGEAVPVRKTADASLMPGASDLERPNLIFAGTTVASGTGRAVVYATGMLTQFGRIAHLTQTVRDQPTQFHNELGRLSRTTTWVALGIGAIVAAVGFFQLQMGISELILLTLGIVVAAIPEGLQATLTLSLAMAVQRLAQLGILAKKLSIVETLGSVSVICTDKSGTLTENQMTVREMWVARRNLKVSGVGYEPTGELLAVSARRSCLKEIGWSCCTPRCCATTHASTRRRRSIPTGQAWVIRPKPP